MSSKLELTVTLNTICIHVFVYSIVPIAADRTRSNTQVVYACIWDQVPDKLVYRTSIHGFVLKL